MPTIFGEPRDTSPSFPQHSGESPRALAAELIDEGGGIVLLRRRRKWRQSWIDQLSAQHHLNRLCERGSPLMVGDGREAERGAYLGGLGPLLAETERPRPSAFYLELGAGKGLP